MLDTQAKTAFVESVGLAIDRCLDAELPAMLADFNLLVRALVTRFVPRAKRAIRDGMSRALDVLSARAGNHAYDTTLSACMRGAVEALKPHQAALTELRFGDVPPAMLAALPAPAERADYTFAIDLIGQGIRNGDLSPTDVADMLGIVDFPTPPPV